MKHLLIVFSILFLTLAAVSPAEANDRRVRSGSAAASNLCSNEEPQVIVKLATAPTKYIKTKDAFDLTAMHNSGRGSVTLGLAGGPISITMKGRFQVSTMRGHSCIELSRLEVLFWAKPQVHIASNFERGSCEYREVLAHEQKHIRVLRKFVREQAPKLKREVRKIVKATKTQHKVRDYQIEAAQSDVEKRIFKRIQAYQNRIMPILDARQKAIDTPEEYRRVAAQCDNWGKKLASTR